MLMKPTWHYIEGNLLVTVAAGQGLLLRARLEGVVLNMAQTSSHRVLTEWWEQLELHNSSSAFSLLRGRNAVGEGELRDAIFQLCLYACYMSKCVHYRGKKGSVLLEDAVIVCVV